MSTLRIVEYGCDICGARITVSGDGSGYVSPIYCCGILVSTKEIKQKGNAVPEKKSRKPEKKPSRAAQKKSGPPKKTVAAKRMQPKKRSKHR